MENIFDIPKENICEKSENILAPFPEKNSMIFEKNILLRKRILLTQREFFEESPERTHKKLNFYRSIKEKENVEKKFFKKNQIVFFGTETAVFTDLPKTSTKEPKCFLSVFQKVKNTFFLRKNLLRCFFWRHRKRFCQRCEKLGETPKVFRRWSYFFSRMPENDDWLNITQKFFRTKKLHRARKKQFWWNCYNKLPDFIKVFTQCPEILVKHTHSGKEKNIVSPSFVEKSFHSIAEKQMQTEENFFCWLFGKDIGKQTIFQKAHFSSKLSSWYVESCFGSFTWFITLNDWKLKVVCLLSHFTKHDSPRNFPPDTWNTVSTTLLDPFH